MVATLNSLLDPLLDPLLTPAAAERVAAHAVDDEVRRRVETLREKSDAGTLTTEEGREYAELVDALDLIALLKAKARLALSDRV